MKCGLSHVLADEDVIMINKKLTKAGNLQKGSVAPSGVSQVVKRAKDWELAIKWLLKLNLYKLNL